MCQDRVLGGTGVLEPLARVADPLWSRLDVNNAMMGARPGSSFIRRVLTAALEVEPTRRYALGPALCTSTVRRSSDDVTIMPPEVLCVVPPSYSFRFFEGRPFTLPRETLLIHHVASNHRRILAELTHEQIIAQRDQARFFQLGAHGASPRPMP